MYQCHITNLATAGSSCGGGKSYKIFFEDRTLDCNQTNFICPSCNKVVSGFASTPFAVAVQSGNVDIISGILNRASKKQKQEALNPKNVTPPLYIAAAGNNLLMIEYLIESGSNVDQTNEQVSGMTPLKRALDIGIGNGSYNHQNPAERKTKETIIKLLLKEGADINHKRTDRTPINEEGKRLAESLRNLIIKGKLSQKGRVGMWKTRFFRVTNNPYITLESFKIEGGTRKDVWTVTGVEDIGEFSFKVTTNNGKTVMLSTKTKEDTKEDKEHWINSIRDSLK